jgi:hypothetical protein
VIAGTNAGRLNGVMLATAIAHDATLDPGSDDEKNVDDGGPWLRDQWRQLGEIVQTKLLPTSNSVPTGSVLDGEYFLREAERLLRELAGDCKPTGAHPGTLFTTASDLSKQGFEAYDFSGQRFEVSDHRFLNRFSTDVPTTYDPATVGFPVRRLQPTRSATQAPAGAQRASQWHLRQRTRSES